VPLNKNFKIILLIKMGIRDIMVKFSTRSAIRLIYPIILILTFSAFHVYAQQVTNGSYQDTAPGSVTAYDIDGWLLDVGSGVNSLPDFEIIQPTVPYGNRALKMVITAIGSTSWRDGRQMLLPE
jgi:hypothetical protein